MFEIYVYIVFEEEKMSLHLAAAFGQLPVNFIFSGALTAAFHCINSFATKTKISSIINDLKRKEKNYS